MQTLFKNRGIDFDLERLWPRTKYFLLIIALVYGVLYTMFRPNFSMDKSIQITTARSFMEGHHFSIPSVDQEDLSARDYQINLSWPQGYPFIMACLLRVVDDIYLASAVFDATAVVLFFTGWFLLCERLRDVFPPPVIFIMWLYWSCVYFPLRDLPSTEMMTLGLLPWTALAILTFFKKPQYGYVSAVLAGLPVALICTLRYTCWPFAALPAMVLAVIGLTTKNMKTLRAGAFSLLIPGLGVCGLLIDQAMSGKKYVESRLVDMQGLDVSVLLHMSPFPVQAFREHKLILALIALPFSHYLLWGISAVILYWLFQQSRSSHLSLKKNPCDFRSLTCAAFYAITISIMFLIVSLLVYVSLRLGVRDGYVEVKHYRYYSPVYAFLHPIVIMGLIGFLTTGRDTPKKFLKNVTLAAFAIYCAASLWLHVYSHVQQLRTYNFQPVGPLWEYAMAIIDEVKAEQAEGHQVVSVGFVRYISGMQGAGLLTSYDPTRPLASKRPVTLFIEVSKLQNKHLNSQMQELVRKLNPAMVYEKQGFQLYRLVNFRGREG